MAVTLGVPGGALYKAAQMNMSPVFHLGIVLAGAFTTVRQINMLRANKVNTLCEERKNTINLKLNSYKRTEMDYQFAVWAARKAHTKPLFPVVRAFAGGVWHGIRNNATTSFVDSFVYGGKLVGELVGKIPPIAKAIDLFRVMGRDLTFRSKFGEQIRKEPESRYIRGTLVEAGPTNFHVLEKERILYDAQGNALIREALKVASRSYRKRVVDPSYAA